VSDAAGKLAHGSHLLRVAKGVLSQAEFGRPLFNFRLKGRIQLAQSLFAVGQTHLRQPAIANIAKEAQEDRATRHLHVDDRQLHRKLSTILIDGADRDAVNDDAGLTRGCAKPAKAKVRKASLGKYRAR
jgi:hypothetical protein